MKFLKKHGPSILLVTISFLLIGFVLMSNKIHEPYEKVRLLAHPAEASMPK